ncbi:MAG: endo-1,4-beta-xylanase, partial [Treponemataceae bacterium]|nr:endo-1,4-beta-xylanase [Treponemataceae bacterium]
SAIYKDESYVVLAYKIVAGLAKEDEKIVYSDSNLHLAKKRDAVIKLLGLIKKAGGRVDEVGVISHLTADWPSRKDYFAALKTIAKQNVSIHISQLDIAPAGSKKIADCYADFMGQVLENKSIISGVSFRKLVKSSEKTYIDSMRGPLFDSDFSPNDSYFSILKAAEKYKK